MDETDEVEILLVEDDVCDAELAIRALEENKRASKLVWVKDGAKALEFIFGPCNNGYSKVRRRPKVVLLDMNLPKVDGLDVLLRLKSDASAKTIPVVVFTSSAEELNIVRNYEMGANSYIVKPVIFDNFSKVIAQLGAYWVLMNQSLEWPVSALTPSVHSYRPRPIRASTNSRLLSNGIQPVPSINYPRHPAPPA